MHFGSVYKQNLSMEQLLELVDDWKDSIDDFENLQPTRVELGEFAELKYACVMEESVAENGGDDDTETDAQH